MTRESKDEMCSLLCFEDTLHIDNKEIQLFVDIELKFAANLKSVKLVSRGYDSKRTSRQIRLSSDEIYNHYGNRTEWSTIRVGKISVFKNSFCYLNEPSTETK